MILYSFYKSLGPFSPAHDKLKWDFQPKERGEI